MDGAAAVGAGAPTLDTARLRLRAHGVDDFAACAALWIDPVVCRYTTGEPAPASRTWQRLLAYRGHWALLGFGYWAVEERASGRYVGELGFANFQRNLGPDTDGLPEIGWALSPLAHGRGYATEALGAVLDWGDARFAEGTTFCIIHRDNAASLRVAAKLGYSTVIREPAAPESNRILARNRSRA